MSKKKSAPHKAPVQQKASAQRKTPTATKKANPRALWITAAVVVLIVGGVWAAGGSGGKKAGGASPEEQKYIGRFLPAGYEEPKIAGVQAYTTTVNMSTVTPELSGAGISIAADQVVANKIVYFEYQKPGAKAIPMIAYIKPSGKLFVGVSYCPPCQGKGQRIEAGGTLVCETCGTVRTLESGVGLSGACRLYPLDELPASLANGKITVDKAALDTWTPQPLDRPTGA